MQHFAIIWRHPDLSLAELQLINPINLKKINIHTVLFDIEEDKSEYIYNILKQLAGVSKRGKIISLDNIDIKNKTIWTNNDDLWMMLKKQYWAKRYKFVELIKSDLEIKQNWLEIIQLWEWIYGQVLGYQNIPLFEKVDFEKPSHGMQIGMMPSKLTNIMLNIWLANLDKVDENTTIYDPFCGFGTTGFVANALGYNFVWSDINISMIKPNKKRRFEDNQNIYIQNKLFTTFRHDVQDPRIHPVLNHVNLIVTEWWLGPVTNKNTHIRDIISKVPQIAEIYLKLLENANNIYDNISIVMTYPVYRRNDYEDIIWPELVKWMDENNWWYKKIDLYYRKDHTVARQVILCYKKLAISDE